MIWTIIDIAKDKVKYRQMNSIWHIFIGDLTVLVQGHSVFKDFFQLCQWDVGVWCIERYQCKLSSRLIRVWVWGNLEWIAILSWCWNGLLYSEEPCQGPPWYHNFAHKVSEVHNQGLTWLHVRLCMVLGSCKAMGTKCEGMWTHHQGWQLWSPSFLTRILTQKGIPCLVMIHYLWNHVPRYVTCFWFRVQEHRQVSAACLYLRIIVPVQFRIRML